MTAGIFMPSYRVGQSGFKYVSIPIGAISVSGSTASFTETLPSGLLIIMQTRTSFISARNLTGVTVNSNAGTVVRDEPQGTNNQAAICSFVNTSAGSKTVEFTHNGSVTDSSAHVIVVTGYKSDTAYASNSSGGTGSASRSTSLDVPADGAVFALITKGNTNAVSWSGASEIDQIAATNTFIAALETDTALTGHTISGSWSGAAGSAIVAASWS